MSTDKKHILIVEDNPTSATFLKRFVERAGMSVTIAVDGMKAWEQIEETQFDAIISDWMMPNLDGIELLRKLRSSDKKSQPIFVIYTSLNSENARQYSKECGANDFFVKPTDPTQIIARLEELMRKRSSGVDSYTTIQEKLLSDTPLVSACSIPQFVGVCVAASTGGPSALLSLFHDLSKLEQAAIFVVLHGPAWMMDSFAQRLERESNHKVLVGSHGMKVVPGYVYLAPGDEHMIVNKQSMCIELNKNPKENFVRPAADPLFRSVATTFGKHSLGVVLTGLGCDGAKGASVIAQAGGTVLVQDPASATAPSMPQSVIATGIQCITAPLHILATRIENSFRDISLQLHKKPTSASNTLPR